MTYRITLDLSEATDEQLRMAVDEARRRKDRCERQPGSPMGSSMHTWDERIDALDAELLTRRRPRA